MSRPSIFVDVSMEKEMYTAGETVSGTITIDCQEDNMTQGLEIKMTGESNVHWTEERTTTTGTGDDQRSETVSDSYRSSEAYFTYMITDQPPITIREGRTEFPFSYTLPLDIPCSFNGYYGSVKYELKVVVKRSIFRLNYRFSREFQVRKPYDLNGDEQAMLPVTVQKDKTVCCWCCKSDPITGILKLPRIGYCPGEYISFHAQIINSSRSVVTGCKLTLSEVVTYHAQGRSKSSTTDLVTTTRTGLSPGEQDFWQGNDLQIPIVSPTKLGGYCTIIDVNYQIRLDVKIRSANTLRVNAPIIVGSVPLKTIYMIPVAESLGVV